MPVGTHWANGTSTLSESEQSQMLQATNIYSLGLSVR